MEIVDILSLLVPNVWTALTQLCATAVLFFLMYRFAWTPVRKILDTRSEFEQAKLADAEKLKAENEALNTQLRERMADADEEAAQIITKAREEGVAARNELLEEGKKANLELLDRTRRELELDRSRMLDDMHDDIVEAAVMVAEKMLQSKIDADSERESIESFVKEVVKK